MAGFYNGGSADASYASAPTWGDIPRAEEIARAQAKDDLGMAALAMYLLLRDEFGHALQEALICRSGATETQIAAALRYAVQHANSWDTQ